MQKRYIFAGGSKGVGLEVTRRKLEQGHFVHVMSRSRGDLPDNPNLYFTSLTDSSLGARFLDTEQKRESSNKRHPLGRYGQPGDIALAVEFLVDDSSSWMTGQVLHVDGGLSVISKL